jgi:hypothetical protein
MKKKWPHRRRSIRDDIRLVISEWLIRFACSLRERKSGSLEWLQMLGKEQQPKDYDTTRKPDDLEFGLFEIAYLELFFVEDFAKLQSGLNSLLDRYGFKVSPQNKKDIEEFFHSATSYYSSGGWSNVGFLNFDSEKRASPYSQYFKSAHLQLLHLSPSTMTLVVSVSPSIAVQKRISKLVATDAKRRQIITRFSLRRGITGSQWIPASMMRQEELEDILVELKKKVTQLLKDSVGGIFVTTYPPLPSLEVFYFEGGKRGTTEQTAQQTELTQASEMPIKERNFWRTMNMSLDCNYAYKKDWLTLYLPEEWQTTSQLDKPYRALIDRRLFQKVESLDLYVNLESAMSHQLSCLFTGVSAPVAIRDFLGKISEEAASIRQYMVPPLTRAGRYWKTPFKISILFKRKRRLDIQNFSCERIVNELEKEDFVYFSRDYGLQSLKRERYGEGDTASFIDDLIWQIEEESKLIARQVKLLRSYYHDLINLSLQRTLLVLTVVLVVLAVLAMPENIRVLIYGIVRRIVDFFSGIGS